MSTIKNHFRLESSKIEPIEPPTTNLNTRVPLFSSIFVSDSLVILGGGGGSKSSGLPSSLFFAQINSKGEFVSVKKVFTANNLPLKIIHSSDKQNFAFSFGQNVAFFSASQILSPDFFKTSCLEVQLIQSTPLFNFSAQNGSDMDVKNFCFSHNKNFFAVCGLDNVIRLYNNSSAVKIKNCSMNFMGSIVPAFPPKNLHWRPKRSSLCVTYNKNFISLYNTDSPHQEQVRLLIENNPSFIIPSAKFFSENTLIALLNNKTTSLKNSSAEVVIWTSNNSETEWRLSSKIFLASKCIGLSLETSLLSDTVAVSLSSGKLCFLSIATNKIRCVLNTAHQLPVTDLAFCPNSQKIVSVGADYCAILHSVPKAIRGHSRWRLNFLILLLSISGILMALLKK